MPGVFITGTDTEIGKTYVSCQLANLLVEAGLKVALMKPIASGAEVVDGSLQNDDALQLINASNLELDYFEVNPYVFEDAVSPHIAAAKAGVEINLQHIKGQYAALEKKSDIVIVEGVGGWFAPLSLDTTVADMAEVLSLPVILVIGMRLGCLNHALLSLQALRQSKLTIAGWITNHMTKNFDADEENIETLKHFLYDIPYLANLPYAHVKDKHEQNTQKFFFNKQQLIEQLRHKKSLY